MEQRVKPILPNCIDRLSGKTPLWTGPRVSLPYSYCSFLLGLGGISRLGSSPHQLSSERQNRNTSAFIAAADFSPRWEWEAKGVPALGDGPGPILGAKGPPFSLHLQKDP